MRRVLPAVLVATLGAFSFGYHLGIVNPALEHLARDLGIAANVQIMGAVVSTVLVGATFGSLFAGKLADVFGRKASLSAVAVPLVVGSVMCSFAPNVAMMLLGRLLCGLGIGASSNLVPMYIAEISPEKVRGTLGSLNQLGICVGIRRRHRGFAACKRPGALALDVSARRYSRRSAAFPQPSSRRVRVGSGVRDRSPRPKPRRLRSGGSRRRYRLGGR